jgi:acylphosphatase
MAREQVVAIVRGRVQGVFFRASAQREAARLGLVGWVRNLADGSVEILAEGERAPLERLIAWAQHGPEDARVDAVETCWGAPQGDCAGFMVTSDR